MTGPAERSEQDGETRPVLLYTDMIGDYRVVTVTPGGRPEFLQLLIPHLVSQRADIDEHIFYVNTNNRLGISMMENAAASYRFVRLVPGELPYDWWHSIYPMYKRCCDPNTVYIKLDDDVCYLSPGFVRNLVEFRLQHPEFFLVYPLIVNNSMDLCLGIEYSHLALDGPFAVAKHRKFLAGNYLEKYCDFDYQTLPIGFQAEINACCWFGRDFAAFEGVVPVSDENFLAVVKPAELKRPNAVTGSCLACHYAFNKQLEHVNATGVLNEYVEHVPYVFSSGIRML